MPEIYCCECEAWAAEVAHIQRRLHRMGNAMRQAIELDTYFGMQGMIATDLQQALDADIMSCTKPLESPT